MTLPKWWDSKIPWKVGDCFSGMKLIPDESVDAIVTDPPFGIGFKYGKSSFKDKNCPKLYWEWLKPRYDEMLRVLKPGGFFAIWQTQLYFKYFWDWFGEDVHIYSACKNFVQLKKTPINYAYDPVVMFYKKGASGSSDATGSSATGSSDAAGSSDAEPLCPKKPQRNVDFFVANLVAETDNPARRHPCPRPIDQVTEIVRNFTVENALVLDPFLGYGSTLVACKSAGRTGIGFELDKNYVSIIKERFKSSKDIEGWK